MGNSSAGNGSRDNIKIVYTYHGTTVRTFLGLEPVLRVAVLPAGLQTLLGFVGTIVLEAVGVDTSAPQAVGLHAVDLETGGLQCLETVCLEEGVGL